MDRMTCAECGEPILAARLEALPNTRLCTNCKSANERKPKPGRSIDNPIKVVKRKKRGSQVDPNW
jgi:RNA polymerase-binding transcription factor DksA